MIYDEIMNTPALPRLGCCGSHGCHLLYHDCHDHHDQWSWSWWKVATVYESWSLCYVIRSVLMMKINLTTELESSLCQSRVGALTNRGTDWHCPENISIMSFVYVLVFVFVFVFVLYLSWVGTLADCGTHWHCPDDIIAKTKRLWWWCDWPTDFALIISSS